MSFAHTNPRFQTQFKVPQSICVDSSALSPDDGVILASKTTEHTQGLQTTCAVGHIRCQTSSTSVTTMVVVLLELFYTLLASHVRGFQPFVGPCLQILLCSAAP